MSCIITCASQLNGLFFYCKRRDGMKNVLLDVTTSSPKDEVAPLP